jgi:3',5'-cyclic AMP phosphodiesterase CpdA
MVSMFFVRSAIVLALAVSLPAETFITKPYLQIGNAAKGTDLVLLWHAGNENADWKVEIKKGSSWRAAGTPTSTLVEAPAGKQIPAVAGKKAPPPPGPAIEAHRVYRAALNGLKSGEEFTYRVSQNGKVVFEATAHARKTGNQAYRFVTFGDTAQDTPSERAIVYQTSLAKPDFVFIPGDIVYGAGRISEYRHHYFPVFNADEASATTGAPLIRSIPTIAAPGNHDTANPNFQRYPDAMAYFLYWDQPLNGPLAALDTKNIPSVNMGDLGRSQFLTGASDRFPRMANFSYDYGNSHWLVLDSNSYADWTNAELRAWVKKDLESAKNATWRFVGFHHPGFNSAKEHFDDQWMRVLSDIFEEEKVDVVFMGHVHNYQRSFPLTFVAKPTSDGKMVAKNGDVAGEFKFDKEFGDGATSKPKGVIYIVTGGGGAGLYNPEMQKMPETWQPFTNKFISEIHSFTVVDIDGKKMKVKQISETGEQVDAWQIVK